MLVPDRSARVLLPGVGNDEAMVDMYDAGWTSLTAFDYSEEAVACAARLFGDERLQNGVALNVADAKKLPYAPGFDAALDKGTLDAVYLSGGRDAEDRMKNLQCAVNELGRVIRPGGVVLSVTGAAADHLPAAFTAQSDVWRVLWDGSPHITEDGFASINVDATLLAWERR